ncbi:hypothetical protein MIND_01394800 [Mycena indigotica]|uniref:Uncharacterized protein n=1 Tax=Mycena indigotica TaxID=2126181 RepID=A0A8H6VV25_9AGAR|nr:uncharacterized protein MIND_01394800 [Mycena indigotica]KAF7289329.1 hypothetical protein MIND_01394800 [Mycena indigotica]
MSMQPLQEKEEADYTPEIVAAKEPTHDPPSPARPPFISAFPFISTAARVYLESLHDQLATLIKTGGFFVPWAGRRRPRSAIYSSPDTLAHIQTLGLNTMDVRDDFNLSTHDLGRFSREPVLKERLSRLFSPNNNQFLVNGSASGKTRLCYEGLCNAWGLYFTIVVDGGRLGSLDIQNTVEKCSRGSWSVSAYELVTQQFGAILLTRLLFLLYFLDILSVNGAALNDQYKLQWLQFQLHPRSVYTEDSPECFFGLAELLIEHDSAYMAKNIANALRQIKKAIGADFEKGFFIVIDEAQEALEQSAMGESLNQRRQPLLVDLLQWTSDTGASDDPDEYEAYVSKFLPPLLRDSSSGHLLMARMWRWLRGRYRLTDGFLTILICEGLDYPHTCLSDYLKTMTHLRPLDVVQIEETEKTPPGWGWTNRLGRLNTENAPTHIKEFVTEALYRTMATHESSPFGAENAELVNRGYGYWTDDKLTVGVLNEPSLLASAARSWFPLPERPYRQEPNRWPATFIGTLDLNPPSTPDGVAHCLVFYFSQVFGTFRLFTDIFKFPHQIPLWARQTARLVRWYCNKEGQPEYSTVDPEEDASRLPLATRCSTLDDTKQWLEHRHGTTFCLSSLPNFDILFSLQLADESFLWVSIRACAVDEPMSDADLSSIVAKMDIDQLFSTQDLSSNSLTTKLANQLRSLPGLRTRPSLLRVVSSFPVVTSVDRAVDKRTRDVASVNLKGLRGREDQVMQEDVFCAIINGITAVGQKRKSRWDDEAIHLGSKRVKELVPSTSPIYYEEYFGRAEPHYNWDERN